MLELSLETSAELDRLGALGDRHAEAGDFPSALEAYWSAWNVLPDPKQGWRAATWILAAVGDANFRSGDFTAGRDNLSHAMQCPGALGNPCIHLRLGQCQLEPGNLDRSADELMRAYMGDGPDVSPARIPSIWSS